MHKCPSYDTYVQMVQGYVAVKALLPVGLDAEGEGLFRDVIPDGSARALSRYSELVDGLIREQMERWQGPVMMRVCAYGSGTSLMPCRHALKQSHIGAHTIHAESYQSKIGSRGFPASAL